GVMAAPADRAVALEPEVLPGAAAVGRLVDAVALHDVPAQLDLAHADVDDVGVRLAHGDGADRRAADLAVGDRAPGQPAVGRLPQPAAGRAEVVLVRPGDAACRGDRATAAVGADVAPSEPGEEVRVVAGARLLRDGRRGNGDAEGEGREQHAADREGSHG